MKKNILIALTTVIAASFPVHASSPVMSNDELKKVVCNNFQQIEDVKTAISQSYIETKTITSSQQKQMLKALASGKADIDRYCANYLYQ
ncbi:MAG: hypothetical protein AAGE96_11790 [Cyanobacteria bacterium P01_G01_bin.19]